MLRHDGYGNSNPRHRVRLELRNKRSSMYIINYYILNLSHQNNSKRG